MRQEVEVINKSTNPVPVTIAHGDGIQRPSIEPYQRTLRIPGQNQNPFEVSQARDKLMWTIEYIALSACQAQTLTISVNQGDDTILNFNIPILPGGTFFFTKLRLPYDQKLFLKTDAQGDTWGHISGYYEPILPR